MLIGVPPDVGSCERLGATGCGGPATPRCGPARSDAYMSERARAAMGAAGLRGPPAGHPVRPFGTPRWAGFRRVATNMMKSVTRAPDAWVTAGTRRPPGPA